MSASTKDLLALTEGILAQSSPVKEVPVPNPILDDGLKAIEVPDSYVNKIIGFAGALKESKEPEAVENSNQLEEAELLEQRVQNLVERLKNLLAEAKTVLQEMTTVGSLGTGNQKKIKPKTYGKMMTSTYGSRKPNKGN
tara:strand:- start:696 stop:1112 length:417 start_codon:yes stop_codon:yes gene_type:complete